MSASYSKFLSASQKRCNKALRQLTGSTGQTALTPLNHLFEAIDYTLCSGGKRIRPTLVYASAQAVCGSTSQPALDFAAAALEMIHTYSLVHDDLPAMDDDDLRRGKPSCHKAYGESCAILVGDALQSRAFEILSEAPGITAAQQISMVKLLATASGARGMVGGQAIDTTSTCATTNLEELQIMHSLKTGALIRSALKLGGIVAEADPAQLLALDNYGQNIGLAFQVVDDILDVEGDTSTLGKSKGKDQRANKLTYVTLMGLDGAKSEAKRLLASAIKSLDAFGDSADNLRDLAKYIVARDH